MHQLTLAQFSGSFSLLLLVVGLGFIIFVHEFGHFIVAKMVGIKVDQFAIGFGRAILCWRKGIGIRFSSTESELRQRVVDGAKESDFGETEYRLNWIPLGGYVKMLGQEDLDPTKLSEDPRSYNKKPIWARVAVVSAGVIMNVIFGALFFIIAFMWGVKFPPAEVGAVVQGSPAATTAAEGHPDVVGLLPGDKILKLKGRDVPADFTDVKINSALSNPDYPVEVQVDRPAFGNDPGGLYTFNLKMAIDPRLNLPYLGIAPPDSLNLLQVGANKEEQEAASEDLAKLSPDLKPGMTLVAVNGTPVQHAWQYDRLLQQSQGEPVTLTFKGANDATAEVRKTPRAQLMLATLPAAWKDTKYKTQDVVNIVGLVPPVEIAWVEKEGPADGKLKKGDIVVSVDGELWPTVDRFRHVIEQSTADVEMVVLRSGERVETKVTPARSWWPGSAPKLKVLPDWADDTTYVAAALPDSAATGLDLLPGTKITAVNGKAVSSYADIRRALDATQGDAAAITCVLPVGDGQEETATLPISKQTATELARLRWMDPIVIFEPLKVEQRATSVGQAISLGVDKAWLFMKQVYITIVRLAQGSVKAEHLSGPVGIAYGGSKFASEGFAYLLYFMGLLSVNLAVINFLPLPIVDGGLFVMLMIEKLRGKPVPLKLQSAITVVGLILLGAVFLFVTFNDIHTLVTGGFGR